MFYIDTSVLVASMVAEPRTTAAQNWLNGVESDSLWISDWSHIEFSTALAKKVRMGTLTDVDHQHVLREWEKLVESSFRVAPILPMHFTRAAGLVNRVELGLRSGDALHLSILRDHALSLASFDDRMNAAAAQIGISLAVI